MVQKLFSKIDRSITVVLERLCVQVEKLLGDVCESGHEVIFILGSKPLSELFLDLNLTHNAISAIRNLSSK